MVELVAEVAEVALLLVVELVEGALLLVVELVESVVELVELDPLSLDQP